MITATGYSKDPIQMADGIVITWSMDMINEKGGLLQFIRFFEKEMGIESDNSLWLQKSRNKPKANIAFVYIIVAGQLRYRLNYVGYETGPVQVNNGDGISFSRSEVVCWNRIVMSGPFVKNPVKRKLKGFQGFRYCTQLF